MGENPLGSWVPTLTPDSRCGCGGSSRLLSRVLIAATPVLRSRARLKPGGRGRGCSGRCKRCWWVAAALFVAVQCEAVHAEREGQQVEVLTLVSDRVGAAQPKCVIECPVDRFGIAATPTQPIEVGVAGWKRADVLGAVEASLFGVVVGVQSDRDRAGAEVVGDPVVVVPAILAVLVGVMSVASSRACCGSVCRWLGLRRTGRLSLTSLPEPTLTSAHRSALRAPLARSGMMI